MVAPALIHGRCPLQALHVPELPLVQNVFPGGADASTHTPSSAALLYSAGARSPTKGSLSCGRPGEGVSIEHLHAEGEHPRLLRSGCVSSEDAGPVYPSSPGAPRLQKRGPAGQTDQPQRVPPNPAPGPSQGQRACGRSRAHSVHQGPSCPHLRGPTVSTHPSRRSPCGGDHRVRPALAEAPPRDQQRLR